MGSINRIAVAAALAGAAQAVLYNSTTTENHTCILGELQHSSSLTENAMN
jgi:hypothetical protein